MNHNLKKVLGEKSDLKFVFNKVEEKFLEQEFGETEMTHISEVINFASILSEEYQLDDADKKNCFNISYYS